MPKSSRWIRHSVLIGYITNPCLIWLARKPLGLLVKRTLTKLDSFKRVRVTIEQEDSPK